MRKLLYLILLFAFFFSLSSQAQTADAQKAALRQWKAGTVVSEQAVKAFGVDHCFSQVPLPDAVFARMQGRSYPSGCTVKRSELRYVRVLHYDLEGRIHIGELVCNRLIADDLVSIFKQLYLHRYPIERMMLIDNYAASDEQSMRSNNTSCFCYRTVKGQRTLSRHAEGRAIDINPLYNPYVKVYRNGKRKIQPSNAARYLDRDADFPYKITKQSLVYRLFIQHGFKWGGAWRSLKDYQHFEK